MRAAFVFAGCAVLAGCAPAARPAAVAPAANHAPRVRARCAPCAVGPAGTLTVAADAFDEDGDAVTYAWAAAAGTLAAPTTSETGFTAPVAAGAVPIAVTVSDGRGGMASDTIIITVTR